MKKIILAAMAFAALAACSKETTVDVAREEIAFANPFVENATKAIDASYSDDNKVEAFKVWGTVQGRHQNAEVVYIFNGDNVTDISGYGNAWACSNVQYWVPNANYAFTAVVDGELSGADLNEIAYEVSSQKDLLLATSIASTDNNCAVTGVTDGGLVAFTFDHLLSKAVFNFYTEEAFATDKYTYEISAIQFDDAYAKGVYTIGETTPWAATVTGVLSFGTAVTLAPSTEEAVEITSEYAKLFIPTTETVNVSFTVTTKYEGKAISVKDYDFEVESGFFAGHAYNFNVKFEENLQIVFTVEDVNDWVNGNIDLM